MKRNTFLNKKFKIPKRSFRLSDPAETVRKYVDFHNSHSSAETSLRKEKAEKPGPQKSRAEKAENNEGPSAFHQKTSLVKPVHETP